MEINRALLARMARERVLRAGNIATRCFDEASEIVVFGSRAAGLARRNSDLDLFCVGRLNYAFKTPDLDFIAMSDSAVQQPKWMQSELASHVAVYGQWIHGKSCWSSRARIGESAVANKRRRIAAFLRALSRSWMNLDNTFHIKYAKKLRRETQRFFLLERGDAVPPTAILDSMWSSLWNSPLDVEGRLRQLAPDAASVIDQLCAINIDNPQS